MNDKERAIFNEVLDLNYEASKEKDVVKKWDMEVKVSEKLTELKKEMGKEAYDKFMANGKAMFAPLDETAKAKRLAEAKGYSYDEDLPPHLQSFED
jgi:hypothetical protein